jgi:ATP phosphoribosyltransferase regulatory subunit
MTNNAVTDSRWLLPDGVDEVLPPQAGALEALRRQILSLYDSWGYDLVMPPAIEYLDALLTGVARDLDVQTFKLTDQVSGRLMGVRADMTPQAARIDAHQLRRDCPVRLCYTGTVLQTRPEGPAASRNPLQVGAELYGHTGIESDAEIIALMIETLRLADVAEPHLDLGHVGIFRGLAEQAGLDAATESRLWEALQRKAASEVDALLAEADVAEPARHMLSALAPLSGGPEVLDEAASRLAEADEPVQRALADLRAIADALQDWLPDLAVHFDLAELRGYQYHTGVVFAAFVPGYGEEIARGGRYDDIGRVFGRARAATGFSCDLKTLFNRSERASAAPAAIAAPWQHDAELIRRVHELRGAGERVIWLLPGHEQELVAMGCNRRLVWHADGWTVEAIEG